MPINYRHPAWIVFVVLCLAGGVYAWAFFGQAFPIVEINLTMDRSGALAKAQRLAEGQGLGPEGFHQVASFSHESTVQNYVELEAGGKAAFQEMIRQDHFEPFQWHVRHYREGKTRETLLRFTPDGQIYGFTEKWPDDAAGPALKSAAARAIAERRATERWNVDLGPYKLISSGQTERSSGRVDHTFVYEHTDRKIGKAEYRLRLRVSGDQLSEVKHFVNVPQAFKRRYQNMRSANRLIQNAGNVVVYGVYLLVGCLLGCFWLFRRRALKWRVALAVGGIITALLFLSDVNSLPLVWMQYDTALSPVSFLLQQLVSAFSSTLIFGAVITISLIAAEGLTRLAFDHHPRFWSVWNPEAAGTKTILSLTVFGYLLLGIDFAYNVGLYSFAHESLGWWIPSNILYNPNILAHYLPWLQPVARSLQAGVWEECLFRAVPLAGAALLGSWWGRRNWWIGITLILQALVFGMGHASYATQPSYARVVELFFAYVGMGGVYLAFGLLPVIIVHFSYDLILMSLPVFVSNAPGIFWSQTIIVLIGLVPLLVVLYGRYYNGEWKDLKDRYFNRSWVPVSHDDTAVSLPVPAGLSWSRTATVLGAGLVGLGLWISFTPFQTQEEPLKLSRNQALEKARQKLRAADVNPDNWMNTARVVAPKGDDDSFVWRKGDPTTYEKLMGSYLSGPYWEIRFLTFKGSVAERAEEYRVRLGSTATVLEHELPESAPGKRLSESAARARVESYLAEQYGLQAGDVEELSAEPQPRPNRRDWTFTYRVPEAYSLDKGEARVRVQLAGSEVVGSDRFVHVPEDWVRDNRGRKKILGLIGQVAQTFLYVLVLAGAFAGIVYWGQDRAFHRPAAYTVFGAIVGLTVLDLINQWPVLLAGLDTAEPYAYQLVIAVIRRIPALLQAALFGLIAGFVHGNLGENQSSFPLRSALAGLGTGLLTLGLLAWAGHFGPDMTPAWAPYGSLDTLVPWLATPFNLVQKFVTGTLVLLLIAVAQHRFTRAGESRIVLSTLGMVAAGAVLVGLTPGEHLLEWGLDTLVLSTVFVGASLYLFRFDRSFLPVAMATVLAVKQLGTLLVPAPTPERIGALLTALLVAATALAWTILLQRAQTPT